MFNKKLKHRYFKLKTPKEDGDLLIIDDEDGPFDDEWIIEENDNEDDGTLNLREDSSSNVISIRNCINTNVIS